MILKSSKLSCPPEHQAGLDELERKVTQGEDLNPHLSRSLKKTKCNDALLNDWGIYHFHLGNQTESDGFIERTGPLLFALISETNFHEINVYDHGNWTNLDIIEILHSEWPETIEHFRLKDVLGLSQKVTSEDIKSFRKANLVSFIETKDGTVYGPPGGGYQTDGTSTNVVLTSHRYIKRVRELQKYVITNIDMILEKLNIQDLSENDILNISLVEQDGAFCAGFPDYESLIILGSL